MSSASVKLKKFIYYKVFKPLGYNPFDYRSAVQSALSHALLQNDLNVCYNNQVRRQYKPGKKNVLVAIESPEVIAHERWIDPEMNFWAEISFQQFSNAPHFFCCRDLYATLDSFVDMPAAGTPIAKSKAVSFIYSHQKHLSGHRFRHALAAELPSTVDAFGSGTGKFLAQKKDALADYRFQIVVENGKYPEYVSEKFFDCLKLQTVPIYWGGSLGLQKMGFDPQGYMPFESGKELLDILETLQASHEYEKRQKAIAFNLERLREIRNEKKWSLYLSPVQLGYFSASGGRLSVGAPKLNLELD